MSFYYFPFPVTSYLEVNDSWPEIGHHIMASFNSTSIILYVSCKDSVAKIVQTYQNLRADNCHLKINWQLTPTFLSAIYNSSWASKHDQEHILALTVSIQGFQEILQTAVLMQEFIRPEAEFEWEPEHDPIGIELNRMALQIRIRKNMLDKFINEMVLNIDDVTPFVRRQRRILLGWGALGRLSVPNEAPFQDLDKYLCAELCLEKFISEEVAVEEDEKLAKRQESLESGIGFNENDENNVDYGGKNNNGSGDLGSFLPPIGPLHRENSRESREAAMVKEKITNIRRNLTLRKMASDGGVGIGPLDPRRNGEKWRRQKSNIEIPFI